MIGQKRARTVGAPPSLEERNKDGEMTTINCKTEVKLLGITLKDNITWGAHLDSGEEAILPELRKTIGHIETYRQGYSRKEQETIIRG